MLKQDNINDLTLTKIKVLTFLLLVSLISSYKSVAQCTGSAGLYGPSGGLCAGQSGTIVLQGSDTETTYVMHINGNISGSSFQGNGTVIEWPATVGYTYQVMGTSGNCSTYVSSIVTVTSRLPGTISFSTNGTPPFLCSGDPITLTPQNGSDYVWTAGVSGSGPGSKTVTPTSSTTYTLQGTESSCLTTVSYSLLVTVTPKVTPSVSVSLNSTSICNPGTIVLTATPTNGGGSPLYTFFVDGGQVASSSSNTYSSSSLSVGNHSCYVIMTSNASCLMQPTGTSATQNFAIANKVNYTALVSGPGQICSGNSSNVYFVATVATPPISGTLNYQWYFNGSAVGSLSTSNDYTFASVSNGNTIYCVVTSDYWCVNSPVQSTNTYAVAITPSTTPTVGIQIPKLTYCSGEPISFTASSTYITGSSTYVWYINGSVLPNTTQSISMTTNSSDIPGYFYYGDVVTVTVNGLSGTCLTTTSAGGTTSGTPITINPMLTPSVSLGLNSTGICNPGTMVLTATPTNGGGSPLYTFFVDGGQVASSSSNTYSSSSLSVGNHSCYVIMTSNASCLMQPTGTSTTQNFTIANKATYTVTVNGPGQICSANSSNVNFVAIVTNAPPAGTLTYQWYFNGSAVGSLSTSNSYTFASVSNGNTIYCVVTSDYWCVNSPVQSTNTYTAAITPSTTPTVGIQIPKLTYCSGESISFTASSSHINGGSSYVWYINGSVLPNTTQSISMTTNSSDVPGYFYYGDVVTVTVNGLSGTCLTSTSAGGTTAGTPITIGQIPEPTITVGSTNACHNTSGNLYITQSGMSGYLWSVSGGIITSGQGTSTATVTWNTIGNQNVSVGYTAANGCASVVNGTRSVTVNAIPTLSSTLNPSWIPSGTLFSYTPTSETVGATFTWSRALIAGITEVASSGSGLVNETLTNTTPSAISAIYTYATTANGCSSSQNVSVVVQPPPYPNENYVRTNSIQIDNVTDASTIESLSIGQRSQAIQYFDGLGRPMQTVVTKASPSVQDMVSPIVYDAFGREARKYLPFAAGTNGWYKPNNTIIGANGDFIGIAQPFYSTTTDKIADDSKPYSQASFDSSPLNRVLEQGAPGTAWQPGTGHTVTKMYEVNKTSEVLLFKYDAATGQLILATIEADKYYLANQLYANKTLDEHGNEIIEYTDKQGRTVCKKVYAETISTVRQYASTYYVYDDFGNLIVVLPPEGVKALTSN